ncbi:MAG: Uncharacterised protein [Cellulomonadaceae bacterium TMED98]|nr:MAG: Uncharacterised protein [Cellulomonadaceae bacterium TMED98]
MFDTEVNQASLAGNTRAVEDVELGLFKRRGHLVLHHFDPGAVTHRIRSLFQGFNPADIQPHRRVELQGFTTGGCFGASEEHTDFFAQLVDENHRGSGLVQPTG